MGASFSEIRATRARAVFVTTALCALGLVHAAATEEVAVRPLEPRSTPAAATLFTPLDPGATGVRAENAYADPRMWAQKYQEFVYGGIGTGVAAADFDNDGRVDFFAVNKTGQSRLFRNLGDWKFEDVTEKAGLTDRSGPEAWKQGASFADVNNDGWLDLYLCRFGAANLLYVNQGNGTFKEEAAARGLAVVDASGVGAFADFDRDGWLDVYVQTNMLDAAKAPKGQRDYLFRNRGDGTFENVTDRAGLSRDGTCGHSVTWWDHDADGWPDIYVANDYDAPDHLYRNHGDGTFTDVLRAVVPHAPYYGMGSDLGDVNNDGRLDLLVADMATSTAEKDQRGMAGSRERAQLEARGGMLPQYMRSALYLNTGTGRMLEAAQLAGIAATDWTWSPRFEDLDNDGRLDLHITNGMVREFHNTDILARVMGIESIAEQWKLIRSLPPMRERNFAFRNQGDLGFENVGAAWGLDQLGVSFGAAFADFDDDGDLDLVFANLEAGVSLLRNDSDTGHRLVVALRGVASNRFGVGARVHVETATGRQVRELVQARGYMSSSEPVAHFGLGDDTAVRRLTIEWPSSTVQVLENVAADQRLTVTEPADGGGQKHRPPLKPVRQEGGASARALYEPAPESGLHTVAFSTPADEPTAQPFVSWRFNRQGPALVRADLNGDGHEDLVLGGNSREPTRLLVRQPQGGFKPSALGEAAVLPDGPIAALDVDGDQDLDLVVTRTGTAQPAGAPAYQPAVWLNDGRGGFAVAPATLLPPVALSIGAVATADFDGDGRTDLFVGARVLPGRYPTAPQHALLRNANGRFEDTTGTMGAALREAGMITGAVAADVDADGWNDLIVATDWGAVKCFRNDGGKAFSDVTDRLGFASGGKGWWTSLAAGDLNGDGRPDFVAGNIGLNTRYRASPEQPALLFHGQFAPTGAPLAIEARQDGERLVPWLTRAALGARIPSVNARYRRNDVYARAPLAEIVGAEPLAKARRYEATQLQSGVFLSQADGTYRFEPLPRSAQLSPLMDAVIADLDRDGAADVYAVQNTSLPVPAIGDFDGGLSVLLRGDGKGGLRAIEPAESGLVVPGSTSAVEAMDLDADGELDLVVAREGDTPLAFRRR